MKGRVSDDIYRAIADPTRRLILDELVERDGQTLYELCARLAMKHGLGSSRQAVSQHLDVLEAAGLVERRRQGRYTFHHLDTRPLRAVTERWPIPPVEHGEHDENHENHEHHEHDEHHDDPEETT